MDLLSALKEKLRGRVPNADDVGCILCRHILDDLEKHGTLTNKVPQPCFDGKPHFPVEGKAKHLYLEGFWTKEVAELLSVKA
jgi:hypothetical protein